MSHFHCLRVSWLLVLWPRPPVQAHDKTDKQDHSSCCSSGALSPSILASTALFDRFAAQRPPAQPSDPLSLIYCLFDASQQATNIVDAGFLCLSHCSPCSLVSAQSECYPPRVLEQRQHEAVLHGESLSHDPHTLGPSHEPLPTKALESRLWGGTCSEDEAPKALI